MTDDKDFYQTTRGQRALQNLGAIDPNDAVQAAMSGLPQFRDVRKTEYLTLRGVLLNHEEALEVIGVSEQVYNTWIEVDDSFNAWATGRSLRQLQYSIGPDVLRARFTRNVFLQLHIDNELLTKRAFNPDEMSEMERKEAAEAGKRYSAPNIAAMMKVLGDSDPDGQASKGNGGETVVKVFLNGEEVVSVEARQAASRALIDQFTQDPGVVEAESWQVQP